MFRQAGIDALFEQVVVHVLPAGVRDEGQHAQLVARVHERGGLRIVAAAGGEAGGPSHLETFDYKPALARLDGQPIPKSLTAGQPIAQLQGVKELRCLGPQHPFDCWGQSKQEISRILPHISQYELAFRMQTSVPELTDFSQELPQILALYGARGGDGTFASNCLPARRLAERGVRFIQVYHRGWDHHGAAKQGTQTTAGLVDRASAALIQDLKQRGMLEETLVIWGGELCRTPMAQADGRDHHIKGFSIWMAGGGIRGGLTYGCTDEFGHHAVENIVDVHAFHATLLFRFGIDHKKLTCRFQGRDFRLTGAHGRVVEAILA